MADKGGKMEEKDYICVVCGGIISTGLSGCHCVDCGIYYFSLPKEKARMAIEKRFLMMSSQKRKSISGIIDKAKKDLKKHKVF